MTQDKPMPLLSDEAMEEMAMSDKVVETLNKAGFRLTQEMGVGMACAGLLVREFYEQAIQAQKVKISDYEAALQSDLAKIEALTKVAQELVDRLAEVKWDVENCDWHCYNCNCDYGMTETDLYDSAMKALASAALLSITPAPEP